MIISCVKLSITGTPGTGKTSVSKLLSKKMHLPIIDLNLFLSSEYVIEKDTDRDSLVVDIERASSEIKLPHSCIIDGHLSHFIQVDAVIVLRCKPKELYERLKKTGWATTKIEENVEAEALNIISEEAREINNNVFDIDTSDRSPDEVAKLAVDMVEGGANGERLDFLEFL